MDTLDDDWELSPETAHPNAAKLMQEPFYWDVADQDSPFGNDAGADTLQFYRAAIDADPDLDVAGFLDELFAEWDVDRKFAEGIPDDELADRLDRESFNILTYDDVLVAVAFGELVFKGSVPEELAQDAIRSLERQALPVLLEFRGWSDPDARRARCEQMIEVLRAAA